MEYNVDSEYLYHACYNCLNGQKAMCVLARAVWHEYKKS